MFVLLVYYAKSTVRWFVMREKYYWMAAESSIKVSGGAGALKIDGVVHYCCCTYIL
jgi:hypothetical protein